MMAAFEYDDIHHWFGLSRDNYFVIPRLALEAMPVEWQKRFIALMQEAHGDHKLETPAYHVLRMGGDYTYVTKADPDDDGSRDEDFFVMGTDPWADYRHGHVEDLCPGFVRTPTKSLPEQPDK